MSAVDAAADLAALPREATRLDRRHLLDSKQLARFVRDGYLRFDEVIPRDLCARWMEEIAAGCYAGYQREGAPFSEIWPAPLAAGEAFRLPALRGIIESLVGPDPRYDHHCAHLRPAGGGKHQHLHQDAEYDPRFEAFDIQISVFPHDVPPEMGGTLFLPGSHFRRVHTHDIGCYHNVVGQVQTSCAAGTVVVWHHNLWHAGRANRTADDRYMFKLRLNPMVRQRRLWNTDDLDDPEVRRTLQQGHRWQGRDQRLELMNRVALWRSLTGDPEFELSGFYHTRIGNVPQAGYRR